MLDAASTGPKWLAIPQVAEIVVEVLHRQVLCGRCELGRWVVMPNHVHLIVCPCGALTHLVRAIKGESARAANKFLTREGQPFWARDYFDRWIRNREHEQAVARYIEWNPVKAGLCRLPEEWPWSSAGRG